MSTPSPLWGNFVSYGDWDLLSFAWLYEGGLHVPGYYHATQSVEKYLKALVLSVLDPDGVHETVLNNAHMWTHDLDELAEMCLGRFPFYGQPDIVASLKRFSEFDQAARYPWAEKKLGKGFLSSVVPLLCDLVRHLRTDIPIKVDDYILGVLLRGYHQGKPETSTSAHVQSLLAQFGCCVAPLRHVFPDVDTIVRR